MKNEIIFTKAYKPLSEKSISELSEEIFKEQFHDYDCTIDGKEVLDAIQNLKENPKLLDYLLKCLANQGIQTVPNRFFCIVVNAEERMPYNEKIHQTFERYKKLCVDDDFGLKKYNHLVKKVFNTADDVDQYIKSGESEEIFNFTSTKFEKYTVHQIGQ